MSGTPKAEDQGTYRIEMHNRGDFIIKEFYIKVKKKVAKQLYKKKKIKQQELVVKNVESDDEKSD